jgi:hypothetical protein
MNDTIQNFIQTVATVFKSHYGDYPQTIGLDRSTRLKEYSKQGFGMYYCWYVHTPEPVNWNEILQISPPTRSEYQVVNVEIVPVIFDGVSYARDNFLCSDSSGTVYGALWFNENGYHSCLFDRVQMVDEEKKR